MANVTLIGEKQAEEGYEFIFRGPIAECKDCKLKTVCFSLNEGRTYRIVSVRPIKHKCKLHEVDVKIVEVEEVPKEVGLPDKTAIEGAVFAIEKPSCNNVGCKHYRLCSPLGIKPGTKYKVLKVMETIDCPDKLNIKRARIT